MQNRDFNPDEDKNFAAAEAEVEAAAATESDCDATKPVKGWRPICPWDLTTPGSGVGVWASGVAPDPKKK